MRALLFSYHCDQQPRTAEGEKRMVSACCIVVYNSTESHFGQLFLRDFRRKIQKFSAFFRPPATSERPSTTEKPHDENSSWGSVHSINTKTIWAIFSALFSPEKKPGPVSPTQYPPRKRSNLFLSSFSISLPPPGSKTDDTKITYSSSVTIILPARVSAPPYPHTLTHPGRGKCAVLLPSPPACVHHNALAPAFHQPERLSFFPYDHILSPPFSATRLILSIEKPSSHF